jgi:neutral ceramidase
MSLSTRLMALLAVASPALAGCAAYHQRILPGPASPPPGAGRGLLRAGFAKVDITPPPGVGLAGNGPEGLPTDGWRSRLYVRAMVLEDPAGERIAVAVVDLAHVSTSLHRLAADRLLKDTGIGADRLIVSATHTHSGPSHFYGEKLYNDQSSRLSGYDPRMERLVIAGIDRAVRQAARSLLPARAAWTFVDIRGVTRNRSVTAYCLNQGDLERVAPCIWKGPDLDSAEFADRAVNPTAAILRVEVRGRSSWQPAGLFVAFAIHGTGMPNVGTALDGDIHGEVTRALDARLRATWTSGDGTPEPVAVFANGNEGDVSPAVDTATRCARPRLGPVGPVRVQRGAEPRYDYLRAGSEYLAGCLRRAYDEMKRVSDELAAHVWSAHRAVPHERLGDRLEIRRAYRTIDLTTHPDLCPTAIAGTAAVGGAEDAPTRIWRWKPLLLQAALGVKLMLYEGAKAKTPQGCHGVKNRAGAIQTLLVGEHGAPEIAQFTVARIGDAVLGTLPGEATTIAGLRMRDAIATGAGQPDGVARVALIGLANGFQQYINTAEEYEAQSYEGGSNLYGPGTAAAFAGVLGDLASRLPPAGSGAPSPSAEVLPVLSYPGPPRPIMADSTGTSGAVDRKLLGVRRDGRELVLEWRDLVPGRLFPNDGQPVAVISLEGDTTRATVDDGDPRIVIRVVDPSHRRGARYEARWATAPCLVRGRLRLPARDLAPALDTSFAVPACR